jgi:outer membrane protein OmpA-like peptidoglycan-associated protein
MRMRAPLAGLVAMATLLSAAPASAQPDIFFIVFFDSNSARVSEPMRAVLDNVVAGLNQGEGSLVLLGNADRAGSAAHNRALACRRARSVRAYLMSHGISADRIGVQSAGEDRPLENTPDGVAEPQNRSVNLTFTDHRLTAAEGAGIRGCAAP